MTAKRVRVACNSPGTGDIKNVHANDDDAWKCVHWPARRGNRGDLELQSPTASPSDNAMVSVVDLAGSTVPTGFSLPPSALSKVLDTWRPPCVAFTSG